MPADDLQLSPKQMLSALNEMHSLSFAFPEKERTSLASFRSSKGDTTKLLRP